MASDPYKILGVAKTATQDEIKSAYRELAKKHHPDRNPGDKRAAELMQQVNEAYSIIGDPGKRAKHDDWLNKPVVIGNKRFSIELVELKSSGDLADVYLGKASSGKLVAVKIARSVTANDLMQREADALKIIRPPGSPDEQMFKYFTPFHQVMKIDDGSGKRQANIHGWNTNFYTLEQVREAFPAGLPMEQAVWMFNRVLEALDYVYEKHNIVHTAVLPCHIMVYSGKASDDPMVHGARIIDWCYSVKSAERPVAIVPKYREWYAPEILDKSRLGRQTDLYMAGASFVYMLGGDPVKRIVPKSVPKYLTEYIKTLLEPKRLKRPDGPWDAREKLKQTLETNYGPRKYVPFDISSTT